MSQALKMHIKSPEPGRARDELELLGDLLPLKGSRVLELGCGSADLSRSIVASFPVATLVATEVDEVQHRRNLASERSSRIVFKAGGAEAIDEASNSLDVVLMFKSLHHVPMPVMDQAVAEIHRVLKPGGLAYFSEPVFAGEFNEIMRLFHDEERVREAAFHALVGAVESGLFELQDEIFFLARSCYENFAAFEDRILKATHTNHVLDSDLYQRVRHAFEVHVRPEGALFMCPYRVDLLRKPDR